LLVFIPFNTIEMRVVDWMVYTCVDRGEPSRGDRQLSLSDREVIESRIRDVNDALQLLSHLMLRSFEELSDLAHRLASAARLRNLLVHRYWAISDRRVYESVKEGLRDFENYIRYVKQLLEGSCHDR